MVLLKIKVNKKNGYCRLVKPSTQINHGFATLNHGRLFVVKLWLNKW